MKSLRNSLVVALMALLLLGSLPLLGKSPEKSGEVQQGAVTAIEERLLEHESERQQYRQQLQEEGEALFAEKGAQLKRARAQKFFTEAKNLKETLSTDVQREQAPLRETLLQHQLQLVLVNLDAESRLQKLEQIATLERQLKEIAQGGEEQLEAALQELSTYHSEMEQRELAQLQKEIEVAMDEEFSLFARAQQASLEEEISKLDVTLRSAFLNRSY